MLKRLHQKPAKATKINQFQHIFTEIFVDCTVGDLIKYCKKMWKGVAHAVTFSDRPMEGGIKEHNMNKNFLFFFFFVKYGSELQPSTESAHCK